MEKNCELEMLFLAEKQLNLRPKHKSLRSTQRDPFDMTARGHCQHQGQ